jgi:hypothetical protein
MRMPIQAAGVTYQVDARLFPLNVDTFVTWGSQAADLPNSKQIIAGGGIVFDTTTVPGQLIIEAPAGATPEALTRTNDTNVTLTLTGDPNNAVFNATNIAVGWSGTLSADRGGTGIGAYAIGDILYASAANALTALPIGAAGQVLSAQGAGLAPQWRSSAGGAISMGYNFSTDTAATDPGIRKLKFNFSGFNATEIYINETAQDSFDATTILSLLQTGNRIYMQQQSDGTRAVVFQVTGPAVDNGSWWTIPVVLVDSRGVLFGNNADLAVVFIMSISASAAANPTASVGLVAVNGVATTWMRSDAAPALSVTISPTWTGNHTFAPAAGGTVFYSADGVHTLSGADSWMAGTAGHVVSYGGGTGAGATLNEASFFIATTNWGLSGWEDKPFILAVGGSTRLTVLATTGAWGLGGANYGTAGQVITSNGSGAAPTWQTVAGGITGLANPSATIGLAAVNGAATTAMRSDGAPALSQAIAPTWTGVHFFNGAPNYSQSAITGVTMGAESGYASLWMTTAGSTADYRKWAIYIGNGASGRFQLSAWNDATNAFRDALVFDRTGIAITTMSYGNITDLPAHYMYGLTHFLRNGAAATYWRVPDATADNKVTQLFTTGAGGGLTLTDDAIAISAFLLNWTRSGNAVTLMEYGNSTNWPEHTVYGAITVRGGTTTPWTGSSANSHVKLFSYNGIYPALVLNNSSAPANERAFDFYVHHNASGGHSALIGEALNDAAAVREWLRVLRNGIAISNITLGNATDVPYVIIPGSLQVAQNEPWGISNAYGTYPSFDSGSSPTIPYGTKFVQGASNGPGGSGETQYYHMRIGLGSEYINRYGMDIAIPRTPSGGNPYMYIRFLEEGSFAGWAKIWAGYADSSDLALKFNSTSHPGTYWLVNNWDGTYWSITGNLGAPVRVKYADRSSVPGGFGDGLANHISSGITINSGDIATNGTYTVVNTSGSAVTITQGTSTLYLAGVGTTGNKTLAAYGICTIRGIASGVGIIAGNVT